MNNNFYQNSTESLKSIASLLNESVASLPSPSLSITISYLIANYTVNGIILFSPHIQNQKCKIQLDTCYRSTFKTISETRSSCVHIRDGGLGPVQPPVHLHLPSNTIYSQLLTKSICGKTNSHPNLT